MVVELVVTFVIRSLPARDESYARRPKRELAESRTGCCVKFSSQSGAEGCDLRDDQCENRPLTFLIRGKMSDHLKARLFPHYIYSSLHRSRHHYSNFENGSTIRKKVDHYKSLPMRCRHHLRADPAMPNYRQGQHGPCSRCRRRLGDEAPGFSLR
jgi:hypothetical protein